MNKKKIRNYDGVNELLKQMDDIKYMYSSINKSIMRKNSFLTIKQLKLINLTKVNVRKFMFNHIPSKTPESINIKQNCEKFIKYNTRNKNIKHLNACLSSENLPTIRKIELKDKPHLSINWLINKEKKIEKEKELKEYDEKYKRLWNYNFKRIQSIVKKRNEKYNNPPLGTYNINYNSIDRKIIRNIIFNSKSLSSKNSVTNLTYRTNESTPTSGNNKENRHKIFKTHSEKVILNCNNNLKL